MTNDGAANSIAGYVLANMDSEGDFALVINSEVRKWIAYVCVPGQLDEIRVNLN